MKLNENMSDEGKRIIEYYEDNLNSPLTKGEIYEIKSVLEDVKVLLPLRECDSINGGCDCGQVWSIPADVVALCSNFEDEDSEQLSKEEVILMAKYARMACNYFPRLINLLEVKEV